MKKNLKIFIHPGMSKTGTTYLQKLCFSNIDEIHNIWKPDFMENQKLIDIRHSILGSKNYKYDAVKLKQDSDSIIKKLEKTIDIFQNEIKSNFYKQFNFFDLRILGRVYMSNKKC